MRAVVSRLLGTALVVLAVVSLTFVLVRSLPGTPFQDGKDVDPAVRANILRAYDLDAPLGEQYVRYLGDVFLRFDLGPSFSYRDYDVTEILAESLPVSLLLGGCAMAVALVVGLGAGALAARRRGQWTDTLVMTLASVGAAVPNFVLAGVLVLVFVFGAHLLPVAGLSTPAHLVLPSLALGLPYAASIARLFRTGLLEVLGEDWIRTARAKGLSPTAVLVRHAARPALLPVVSFLGPALAGVLSGSLVIERVFAVPGMGSHFVESAFAADYNLALGVILVYTLLVSAANLAVDVAYGLLDPRIGADA
ncbi:MAG: ABC transporter permease [Planctomycetes bacterium]|nr:ABC transporter permease [Planctomycetota bacterium]